MTLVNVRDDFPALATRLRGDVPLVYLDSAATSHKPQVVLDAEASFYTGANAAVHRGAHQMASQATELYEDARQVVANFVGAQPQQLVWTKNATEALNLVAHGVITLSERSDDQLTGHMQQRLALRPGDEVVITEAEHHANLVPWQQVCQRTGATLRWLPVTDEGRIDLADIDSIINTSTKIVAFSHVSNVTGAITDVGSIVAAARKVGALTFLDACQSVPYLPVDFAELGVDALAFSGHKMLGPTGVGCLVGSDELLEALPPFMTGGSMVEIVTMEETTFAPAPARFEAGTQMVAQTVGLAAAVRYLENIGMEHVAAHEQHMAQLMLEGIATVPDVRVLGPLDATNRLAVVAFSVDGVHPHDVGQLLDNEGIAVRVGHHCAQPVHRALGVHASARVSAAVYNTPDEVDAFIAGLKRVRPFFVGGH